MRQFYLTYDQADFSRYEFLGESLVQKMFILLKAKNEEDAEIEARDRWAKILKASREKWDAMIENGMKTKMSFHDWQPKNQGLLMRKALVA